MLNIEVKIKELLQDIVASKIYNDITFNDIALRAGVETLKQSLSLLINEYNILMKEHNDFMDKHTNDRITTSGYEKMEIDARQLAINHIKRTLFER